MVQLDSQPEITQFDHTVFRNEQIVWFDVLSFNPHYHHHSVNDVPVVEVAQTQQTTTHHLTQLVLAQPIPTPQIRLERATMTVLHHNLHITHSPNITPTTLPPSEARRCIAR